MGLGVDLAVTTNEYGTDDREWLGSAHGTQATRTVTIASDDFIGQTIGGEVIASGDTIPSGIRLGIVTATGLATISRAAATDGSQNAAGHLMTAVKVTAGRRVGVALLDHGKVKTDKLPAGSGDGADAPHIIYI